MYNCLNCGGNLRFDIPSQRLKCPYCESDYDCYEIEKELGKPDSAEDDSYDVTVFSCPQCGGEIISSDQSVSEFCSYCGSAVVLDQKLIRKKRPQKILPFQKTSEDCIKAYKNKLKGAVFAPRQLKDASFLERFRGIYIPYWSYGFSHKGDVSLTSEHEYRSGDYDVTEYYDVSGKVDADYDGILFDASSSFDDSISEAIAPYDPGQLKDFVPSYLSGFYADVADVPADTYQDEANVIANTETIRTIQGDREAGKYTISDSGSVKAMNKKLSTQIKEPVSAMLPVWFLTWRDRDRVAYMTVNGQTGKVAADIPIDLRKYIFASLICAIPLYFILNAVFSFTAPTTLFFSGLFCLISGIIYYEQVCTIVKKDNRELDRGFQRKAALRQKAERRKAKKEAEASEISAVEENSKKGKAMAKKTKAARNDKKEKKPVIHRVIHFGMAASLIFAFVSICAYYINTDDLISAFFNRTTLNLVLIAGVFVFWEIALPDVDAPIFAYRPERGILPSQMGAILAGIVNIIHPVSDLIYYVCMLIAYIGIFVTLISVIRKYNLLITRPIPELHNRGTDTMAAIILILLLGFSFSMLPCGHLEVSADTGGLTLNSGQEGDERTYTVDGSDYLIYFNDEEDLLTEEEEEKLLEDMKPVTDYGHAAFMTTQIQSSYYEEATEEIYHSLFGMGASGTIFLIDMNNRQLIIFSDGDVYDVVSKAYANTITDNIYKMAKKGDYYDCAREAYQEIYTLLSGSKIAQPMRHITNAMLAVILSTMILYAITRYISAQRAASEEEILTAIGSACAFTGGSLAFSRKKRSYNPHSSSGGGSSGGGGGGGSSGGGGSHGF